MTFTEGRLGLAVEVIVRNLTPALIGNVDQFAAAVNHDGLLIGQQLFADGDLTYLKTTPAALDLSGRGIKRDELVLDVHQVWDEVGGRVWDNAKVQGRK